MTAPEPAPHKSRTRAGVGAALLIGLVAAVLAIGLLGANAESEIARYTGTVTDKTGDARKPGADLTSADVKYESDGSLRFSITKSDGPAAGPTVTANVYLFDEKCEEILLFGTAPGVQNGEAYAYLGLDHNTAVGPTQKGTSSLEQHTLTAVVSDSSLGDLKVGCFAAAIESPGSDKPLDYTEQVPLKRE